MQAPYQAPYDISQYELINDYGIIEGTMDSHLLYVKYDNINGKFLLSLYNDKMYYYFLHTDVISAVNINCYLDVKTGCERIIVYKDEDKSEQLISIYGFTPNYSNHKMFKDIYDELVNTSTSGYILK